ncbi:hypothetical protein MMPV_004622 [Pyropia vietnamensis]
MAYDAVREQLDALLGADRNGTSSGPADFTDARVCKHYLVAGFCPLPLFGNTKADMGTCGGIHSEDLRADYLAAIARPPRGGGWGGGGGGGRGYGGGGYGGGGASGAAGQAAYPYAADLRRLAARIIASGDKRIAANARRLQAQYGVADMDSLLVRGPGVLEAAGLLDMDAIAADVNGSDDSDAGGAGAADDADRPADSAAAAPASSGEGGGDPASAGSTPAAIRIKSVVVDGGGGPPSDAASPIKVVGVAVGAAAAAGGEGSGSSPAPAPASAPASMIRVKAVDRGRVQRMDSSGNGGTGPLPTQSVRGGSPPMGPPPPLATASAGCNGGAADKPVDGGGGDDDDGLPGVRSETRAGAPAGDGDGHTNGDAPERPPSTVPPSGNGAGGTPAKLAGSTAGPSAGTPAGAPPDGAGAPRPTAASAGAITPRADALSAAADVKGGLPTPTSPPRRVWVRKTAPDGRPYWRDEKRGMSLWDPPPENELVLAAGAVPPDAAAATSGPPGDGDGGDRGTPAAGADGDSGQAAAKPDGPVLFQGMLMDPQHKLRVCASCGLFLSVFDSPRRLHEHFTGKTHLGYDKLRAYLDADAAEVAALAAGPPSAAATTPRSVRSYGPGPPVPGAGVAWLPPDHRERGGGGPPDRPGWNRSAGRGESLADGRGDLRGGRDAFRGRAGGGQREHAPVAGPRGGGGGGYGWREGSPPGRDRWTPRGRGRSRSRTPPRWASDGGWDAKRYRRSSPDRSPLWRHVADGDDRLLAAVAVAVAVAATVAAAVPAVPAFVAVAAPTAAPAAVATAPVGALTPAGGPLVAAAVVAAVEAAASVPPEVVAAAAPTRGTAAQRAWSAGTASRHATGGRRPVGHPPRTMASTSLGGGSSWRNIGNVAALYADQGW